MLTCWYAFLTQLKIRWALWLPFYFVIYPVWWMSKIGLKLFGFALKIVGRTAAFAATPLIKQLETIGQTPISSDDAALSAPSRKAKSLPKKRVWLLLFFLWLVAFRGLDIWWAAWIAPALALPVWFFFLRTAYQFAITPKTFVTYIATTCGKVLDNQIKMFTDAQTKKSKVAPATLVYNIINGALRRYSEDRMHTVVQREAMALFSIALALALIASSWFWGLIGVAIIHTNRQSLDAYAFFNSGSLTEAVMWAWGCMTTAISFPGRLAPTWLKLVHGCILATGVFQLTFLLVCFSIMINAETTRTVAEATKLLKG